MRALPLVRLFVEHRFRHAVSRLALRDYDVISLPDCLRRKPPSCGDTTPNNSLSLEAVTDDDTNLTSTMVPPLVHAFEEDEIAVRYLYQAVVPIMLLACLVSMIFNLVIILSARKVRRFSPTLYLSLSLAVADAYASLVIGIGLVINSLLPKLYGITLGPFNACFILVLEAFRLGGMVIIVLHLCCLAVNHYIGILRPLHYASTVTRRVAIFAIFFMWLIPILFFLMYFSLVPNDGFRSRYCAKFDFLLRTPFRAITSVLFFVPLVLMSGMYAHMFILVRKHQRGLHPTSGQLHKNVKAIITTLLILGTYIIGWMPAVLYFVLTCLDCVWPYPEIPLKFRVQFGIFINLMIVLKSIVDPIIYVIRMPEIKNSIGIAWRTCCGLRRNFSESEHPNHSRTELNRVTFQFISRRMKVNGATAC